MSNPIYLDYAAATPMDHSVFLAMEPYFTNAFYNPSATYLASQAVKKDLETARAKVAHWFGARTSEIIFTAGTTEANNLVVQGVMRQFPQANLVVSAIEHDSVLAAAELFDHKIAPVTSKGLIDLDRTKQLIDDATVLVSVMYANNEVGTIQPVKQLGSIIEELRKDRRTRGVELPLYLHSDAAQAANYLDLHAARLKVDFMTINGGKIYGPKQSGALFIDAKARLEPQILGGGQEKGLRSGTENVAGSIGLATALEMTQTMRHQEAARLRQLQHHFMRSLKQVVPEAIVNGSTSNRLPNNVHITIPGCDNEIILMSLDERGIMCAAGSACSASNEEPSHVLRAMGISEPDAQASLRFTLGRFTTEADIDAVIAALADILRTTR
jgi:cysteine desulfurase